MKRLIAVLPEERVDDVVDALVRHDVHGVTVEPISSDEVRRPGIPGEEKGWIRVEVVVESHRADEVIESVEAILDSTEGAKAAARLVVENVETVVHIRSGRIIT